MPMTYISRPAMPMTPVLKTCAFRSRGRSGPGADGPSEHLVKDDASCVYDSEIRCAIVVALLIFTTCVPAPKLRPVDGSGRLPIDDILKVVRKNHDKLGRCYADGLGKNPRLAGSIRARFRIATNGTMESVKVLGTTLPDDRVVQCVVEEYKKLEFPSPDGGAAWTVYEIAFYSTNGAVSIIDSDLPNRD